jgi:hypothetical protein
MRVLRVIHKLVSSIFEVFPNNLDISLDGYNYSDEDAPEEKS